MVHHNPLPETGYVRLRQIIGDKAHGIPPIIPTSKSSWYAGIKAGIYPAPTKKFGPRTAAWNVEDIRRLLEHEV